MSCGKVHTRRGIHAKRRVAAHARHADHQAIRKVTTTATAKKTVPRVTHKITRVTAKTRPRVHHAKRTAHKKKVVNPALVARDRARAKARALARARARAHARALLAPKRRAALKAAAHRRAVIAARRHVALHRKKCHVKLRTAAVRKQGKPTAAQVLKAQQAARSLRAYEALQARIRAGGP